MERVRLGPAREAREGLILPLEDTRLVKDLYQAGNPEGYGAHPPGSVQSPMVRVASP